jgi:tetratricopeptide (TPR) repeat protein
LGLLVVLYEPLASQLEVAEAGKRDGAWAVAETALLRRGRASLPALRAQFNAKDHRTRLRCALTAALLGDRQAQRVMLRSLRVGCAADAFQLENPPAPTFLELPTLSHTNYARFGDELFSTVPAPSEEAAWAETFLLLYWRRHRAPQEKDQVFGMVKKESTDVEIEGLEPAARNFDETAFWGQLTQRWPNWAEGHAACARTLLRAGRPYEAKRAALRALRLEPEHFGACLAAARAYSNMGATAESLLFFERLLKTNPRLSAEPRIKALREAVEKVARERARLNRENRRRSAKVASTRDATQNPLVAGAFSRPLTREINLPNPALAIRTERHCD